MVVDELIKQTSTEHDATNGRKFMQRYKTPNLTVADHYRHLKQLYVIYKALEGKVSKFGELARLPQELHFLLHRSELIRKDILFLKPFVSESDNDILQATHDYADAIEECNNGIEIWGHFLSRILADLYGGNKIKRDVYDLYTRANLSVKDGADFLEFEPGTLHKLKMWIEKQNQFSVNALKPHFIKSLAKHDAIFSELEATREGVDIDYSEEDETATVSHSECPLGFDKKPASPKSNHTQYCGNLFSKKIIAAAAITIVSVVAAGMLFTS